MKINFNKPFIAGKELYYIAQAVTTNGWLAGDGPFTKKCHAWLEENLGCRKAFLTHSCTAALEMAALLCDISPGDEIIMPSFTFVSTANAFVLRGATPVFVDICEDTLNINVDHVRKAITNKTKAIVPVHYAGKSCNMPALMDLAHQYGLYVIEDAAQALMSSNKGRYLGTIGHIGCLSFHETKNVISGEGGAILINDESLIERAEIIWEKGTNRKKFFRGEIDKYSWVDIGSSFLTSDLVAAFLFAQLEEADRIVSHRQRLHRLYYQGLLQLQNKGLVRLPYTEIDVDTNGHIFYLITNSLKVRSKLLSFLQSNDIMSTFHYVPLHSSPAGIKYGRTSSSMKVTDKISDTIIRLPVFFEMTEDQVKTVVSAIVEFFSYADNFDGDNIHCTKANHL